MERGVGIYTLVQFAICVAIIFANGDAPVRDGQYAAACHIMTRQLTRKEVVKRKQRRKEQKNTAQHGSSVREKHLRRWNRLSANQIFVCFSPANSLHIFSIDEQFAGARPRVVVARQSKSVSARGFQS